MIKIFQKYVIDTQIFVSLVATLFTLFFMQELDQMRPALLILVFLTYVNGYLYTKYQGRMDIFPYVAAFNLVTFFSCLTYITYHHEDQFVIRWIVVLILGSFYNTPYLGSWVRKIPFAKIFYVAAIWALMNSWVIADHFHWDIFLVVFFFISGLILPFDIRDMKYDKVVTFPRAFGVEFTKRLAYAFFLIALLIGFWSLIIHDAIALALTCLFAGILTYLSNQNRPFLYYAFGVEAMSAMPLVFWGLIRLMMS